MTDAPGPWTWRDWLIAALVALIMSLAIGIAAKGGR